jgi:cation transport regulator ChaB
MPYARNADLPERVRNMFGAKGQEAYRKAFNAAHAGTCRGGGRQGNRESCSHAVATSAAKRTEAMSKAGEFLKALLTPQKQAIDARWQQAFNDTVQAVQHSGDVQIAKSGAVVKADDELQVLYVPALVPEEEDSQGDVVSAEDIREAAHAFMHDYPLFKEQDGGLSTMGVGVEHAERHALSREQACLVETWLEKVDTEYGEQKIPEGTWMIGVHIPDKEIWESAKAGERTGASIEGVGKRVPI